MDEYINFSIQIYSINKSIKEFELEATLHQLYKDVDFPMLKILSEMENEGITVSKEKMKSFQKVYLLN